MLILGVRVRPLLARCWEGVGQVLAQQGDGDSVTPQQAVMVQIDSDPITDRHNQLI